MSLRHAIVQVTTVRAAMAFVRALYPVLFAGVEVTRTEYVTGNNPKSGF